MHCNPDGFTFSNYINLETKQGAAVRFRMVERQVRKGFVLSLGCTPAGPEQKEGFPPNFKGSEFSTETPFFKKTKVQEKRPKRKTS